MSIFDDFVFHSKAEEATIEKYADTLPQELINVWKEYGFGSFLKGFLKIINPDDFQDLLNESYFFGKTSIPIFTTGLGDIIVWQENEYVTIVKYRIGDYHMISSGFEYFFSDLEDAESGEKDFDWNHYFKAIKVKGIPEYDECFGYVPLLALGGSEKAENLEKVKLREHIYLINELAGGVGM
jgi:hypothetical protein